MSKCIIYGLYCPILDRLHYVGKSTSYLTRPNQHMTSSHSEKIKEWVSHLKILGYKPNIKILAECNIDNIDEIELYYIKKAISDGDFILNFSHNTTENITLQNEYQINRKHNVDIVNIGNIIKKRRKELKVSQTKLSELASIDRTTLYHIEKGNTSVSVGRLVNVLKALKLKLTAHI